MPLPDDFSPWMHLHEMLLASYNLLVEQTFVGVPSNDLSTELGGMKVACLLLDDDSAEMTAIRMMLFFNVYMAQRPTQYYSIPITDFQSNIKFHPSVRLVFRERDTPQLRTDKFCPAVAEISFRLLNETESTITEAKAINLANKIKEFFGTTQKFSFEKGPVLVTYKDEIHGYNLKLYVVSETEAVRVIQRVLEVQGHPFNESLVTVHTSRKVFSGARQEKLVYGKERATPIKRRTTRVYFTLAQLHVWGLPHPINLVAHFGVTKALIKF